MEKRFNESDRFERRRSLQNEPASRSSMNDASRGRMRKDRNTRHYIQVHPKNDEDRQRQLEEVHIRSDDEEGERRRLSSSPNVLRKKRGQRQRHVSADRPRQTIPPSCSTKTDPAAFLPPQRPKSTDGIRREETVSSPPSRRYIIQTQRNPERLEGYRAPGKRLTYLQGTLSLNALSSRAFVCYYIFHALPVDSSDLLSVTHDVYSSIGHVQKTKCVSESSGNVRFACLQRILLLHLCLCPTT